MSLVGRYAHWLHTRWPAGTVEPLPEIRDDGTTAIPGVRIVGDLTGIPLLKFASDTGARAVQAILAEPDFIPSREKGEEVLDLAIVGAGVSGIAAAIEAKRAGLRFEIYEAERVFSTVANFPRAKPIYTYPKGMTPAGELQFKPEVHPKEDLLERLEEIRRSAGVEATRARIERIERKDGRLLLHRRDGKTSTALRVIVAIGRGGDHRRLNVPGEDAGKVFNRLYDPKDFAGQDVLVVGGGDSALEAAIALAAAGGRVTISYRKGEFARPKTENVESLPPTVSLALGTQVARIEPKSVVLRDAKGVESAIANDVVFTMIGRKAPLDFFRRSGIAIRGEWSPARAAAFAAFFLFCVFLYNWKSGGDLTRAFERRGLFPFRVPEALARVRASAAVPATALGTLAISLRDPSFYYSLAYCLCVVLFGIRRVRRRRTPYVRRQTLVLAAVQVIPLFLLPYFVLPWLGHNGAFDSGFGRSFADHLFPSVSGGHGREYWRAFGFVLAWPLFVWNVFSSRPMGWWLAIAFVQTFVLIPLAIRRWGKGVYCGWICSCGALAETMGDDHRHKMPHGPVWNRVNMLGQGILAAAFILLVARITSWSAPDSLPGRGAQELFDGLLSGWHAGIVPLNYYHLVDIFLAGIVGVGFYFWFSGRVWCRFACPLAALMHIYARFSKFRIFAEKPRCISCNVCTSVCHQGIDVMSFANKGAPMEDPECVRCSACVQMCPTGVLSFGRIGAGGLPVLDRLPASPVTMTEKGSAG